MPKTTSLRLVSLVALACLAAPVAHAQEPDVVPPSPRDLPAAVLPEGTAMENKDVVLKLTIGTDGSVSAVVRGFAGPGPVKLGTVNGSVTVELPTPLDAHIEANTMNGSVDSDFPLTTTDKFVIRHATGTVGAGGRQIQLHAINGSVRVKAGGKGR